MNNTQAKNWLDRNMTRLLKEFGIPHWQVVTEFWYEEGAKWSGECHPLHRYEKAKIKLNLPLINNTKELNQIVCHELAHILHAPFEMYRAAVIPYLPSKQAEESLDEVFNDAMELTVKAIERMRE